MPEWFHTGGPSLFGYRLRNQQVDSASASVHRGYWERARAWSMVAQLLAPVWSEVLQQASGEWRGRLSHEPPLPASAAAFAEQARRLLDRVAGHLHSIDPPTELSGDLRDLFQDVATVATALDSLPVHAAPPLWPHPVPTQPSPSDPSPDSSAQVDPSNHRLWQARRAKGEVLPLLISVLRELDGDLIQFSCEPRRRPAPIKLPPREAIFVCRQWLAKLRLEAERCLAVQPLAMNPAAVDPVAVHAVAVHAAAVQQGPRLVQALSALRVGLAPLLQLVGEDPVSTAEDPIDQAPLTFRLTGDVAADGRRALEEMLSALKDERLGNAYELRTAIQGLDRALVCLDWAVMPHRSGRLYRSGRPSYEWQPRAAMKPPLTFSTPLISHVAPGPPCHAWEALPSRKGLQKAAIKTEAETVSPTSVFYPPARHTSQK